MCCPGSGPVPCAGGWLALRPSSLGVWLECCSWGEGPPGSQTHPLQQAAQGWLPESDWGQNQAWVSGNGLTPPSVHGCQCHLGRGHAISVQETKCRRTVTPLPIGGQGSPPATTGERPRGPSAVKKGGGTEGQREGDRIRGPQEAPWWADWQADWGWSLWSLANAGTYCRGFSWA